MITPSDEQREIIGAPLKPMSVTACAGSGKTFTAVRRLAEIRRRLGSHRGRVALLSFSNVAVDTFRREYQSLIQQKAAGLGGDRVDIDTLDGFITSHVLRPHAYRTMGARRAAFLVTGKETFLNGFKFRTDTFPRPIVDMQVGVENGKPFFYYSGPNNTRRIDTVYACDLVSRLGQAGAYTHNLGRYWCHRTLEEQPTVLRAFVRRYPHILIDEAQDIGTVHQAIIEQLVVAGCQVSVIGDPNQGIYEFAGANGRFLTEYGERAGVSKFGLTINFRSVPKILDLANSLSVRTDDADRVAPETRHGAFFAACRKDEREALITSFHAAVEAAGLDPGRSAVLCRARELAERLAGNTGVPGQGGVKLLAQAAVLRDQTKDYRGAFLLVASCIVGLLDAPAKDLLSNLTKPAGDPDVRAIRRLVWRFTRSVEFGLPAATLRADSEWHPLLLERTRELLTVIKRDHGMQEIANLGQKLSKRGLPNSALIAAADLAAPDQPSRLRVDTVHQAKGESLDAVLYIANKEHATALLSGVDSEVGRIGYVAVTRARNLFWLGVPANALEELRPELLANGFSAVGL